MIQKPLKQLKNMVYLPMQVTTDENLANYLTKICAQMEEWLLTGMLQKLVLVISSVDDDEVMAI